MGHTYTAIGWNRQKKIYDGVIWTGIVAYIGVFVGLGFLWFPDATIETLLIRALATCAFLLLHVILTIGPLARLSSRFLPLLYNRRHLGVSMFLVALAHGTLSTIQFHAFGNMNPIISIFVNDATLDIASSFPFQPAGFLALVILFLMAATSHDFWLTQLTAPVWKTLHMLVYVAYVLLVAHVVFGILQDTISPGPAAFMAAGALWVIGIHLTAGFRERKRDRGPVEHSDYVDICAVDDILPDRAVIATVGGERVAVFRHGNAISAVSNVCQHQNGPLGEGRIVDGFITCPWHGYQYCPHTGASPPPFTEKIPTFDARVQAGRVLVSSKPNPAGARAVTASVLEDPGQGHGDPGNLS